MKQFRNHARLAIGLIILLLGSIARLSTLSFSLSSYQGTMQLAHELYNITQKRERALLLPDASLCAAPMSEDVFRASNMFVYESDACASLNHSKLACAQGSTEIVWQQLANAEMSCSRKLLVRAWELQLRIVEGDATAIEQILLQNNELTPLVINWGREMARRGNLQEGGQLISIALEKSMDRPLPLDEALVYGELAEIHRRLGRPQEAITAFQTALALGGDPGRWLIGMGIAYRQLEDYDKSRKTLQVALQSNAGNPVVLGTVYEQLGVTELEAGQFDEARLAFIEAYCLLSSVSVNNQIAPTRLDSLSRLLQRSGSQLPSEATCQ